MKAAAIGLSALSLFLAGAASASQRVTDVDYLRASRCKGIATGLGDTDTAGLDAFLKSQRNVRDEIILDRAEREMARGKREARDANMRDQLRAELDGPCLAYRNPSPAPSAAR